jgi:hypothetical protein
VTTGTTNDDATLVDCHDYTRSILRLKPSDRVMQGIDQCKIVDHFQFWLGRTET